MASQVSPSETPHRTTVLLIDDNYTCAASTAGTVTALPLFPLQRPNLFHLVNLQRLGHCQSLNKERPVKKVSLIRSCNGNGPDPCTFRAHT
jgi:hypothetical protein